MSKRCLEEQWAEKECGDREGVRNIGNNTCANLSKRCEKDGKNKSCCKAIYCWGKKIRDDFPDHEDSNNK